MKALLLSLAAFVCATGGALAETYNCSFPTLCRGAVGCAQEGGFAGALRETDTQGPWALEIGGDVMHLQALAVGTGQIRHFTGDNVDDMAQAAALLSLFADGTAFLSIHGAFVAPEAFTYLGTCTPEAT